MKIRKLEDVRSESEVVHVEAADLLIMYLEQLDIEYVYGIPGGAIEPLYNALSRSEAVGGTKAVIARHETGAAFMADGYARNSGKLGVCCATTGPGATNLITGVASAYDNNIPLLVITAQTSLDSFGRKAFQESTDTGVNTVGMFQFCTEYNSMVSHVNQFEQKLVNAMTVAMNRSRPVHLSIPLNVFGSKVTSKVRYDLESAAVANRNYDSRSVDDLYTELCEARNIVFVVGGRCGEAASVILRTAHEFSAQIVSTPDGKGYVSPYHPDYRGVIGFAGHQSAYDALTDPSVDIVVAIGTSLGEWSSNGWDSEALFNDRLIHVEPMDIDFSRAPVARLHVRGEIVSVFEYLMEKLELKRKASPPKPEVKEIPSIGQGLPFAEREKTPYGKGWQNARVKPQWLMEQMTRCFPRSTKYLADTGNSMAWGIHYLHPNDRRLMERRHVQRALSGKERLLSGRRAMISGLFQVTVEFASMGWAIGASVGASMACPNQPVVCITGDGSMLMSGQEITVALEHNLPVIFVILNDGALGMVKHGQRLSGAEQVGTTLPAVDFAMLAKSMGVRSYNINTPHDFMNFAERIKNDEAWIKSGPALLDIHIDGEEVPPIGMRIKTLGRARAAGKPVAVK